MDGKFGKTTLCDQEILDARGIKMTVEEVVSLPTLKYSEKVKSLNLGPDDLTFVKCLRRRIKNRLASQNSRRRSLEHLRRLNRELRAVRKFRGDAQSVRTNLLEERRRLFDKCCRLREHIQKNLKDKSSIPDLPSLLPTIESLESSKIIQNQLQLPPKRQTKILPKKLGCRIEQLLEEKIKKIYQNNQFEINNSKISAKTIFISHENSSSEVKSLTIEDFVKKKDVDESVGVLNLSLNKEGRRSHGRKQSAPRRIAYVCHDSDEYVLDLKVKKEGQ